MSFILGYNCGMVGKKELICNILKNVPQSSATNQHRWREAVAKLVLVYTMVNAHTQFKNLTAYVRVVDKFGTNCIILYITRLMRSTDSKVPTSLRIHVLCIMIPRQQARIAIRVASGLSDGNNMHFNNVITNQSMQCIGFLCNSLKKYSVH